MIAFILYVVDVAYSHFIPSESKDTPIAKDTKTAPVGVRILYEMTSKALGGIPIRPVKPCYVFSTDDTVLYIFEGKGEKDSVFRLCSTSGTTSAGHVTKDKIDDSCKMKGLRLKMTFT